MFGRLLSSHLSSESRYTSRVALRTRCTGQRYWALKLLQQRHLPNVVLFMQRGGFFFLDITPVQIVQQIADQRLPSLRSHRP